VTKQITFLLATALKQQQLTPSVTKY